MLQRLIAFFKQNQTKNQMLKVCKWLNFAKKYPFLLALTKEISNKQVSDMKYCVDT